jgi:type III secretion system FlhB-like substrate exporter
MPKFEIEQYELHISKYEIEAASPAEAIAGLFAGKAESVDNSQVYIDTADECGIPVDENQELVEELHKLGISIGEHIIPSIASVKEVK